jgi:hypothetical protein
LDLGPDYIIEHPDLLHAEAELGLCHSTESLDSALAEPGRLMSQMHFQGIPNGRTIVGIETTEILDRVSGKEDVVAHWRAILTQIKDRRPATFRAGLFLDAISSMAA